MNDCYFTAIPLAYPPHLVAFMSVYMMCIFNGYDPGNVFEKMGVDVSSLGVICSAIRRFYDSGVTLWPSSISEDILAISAAFRK